MTNILKLTGYEVAENSRNNQFLKVSEKQEEEKSLMGKVGIIYHLLCPFDLWY